jgi:HSP20 family protein
MEVKMADKKIIPNDKTHPRVEIVNRRNNELDRLNSEFDHFFDDFFMSPFKRMSLLRGQQEFIPRVDVFESDKEIKITVEIPGMDEKDIHVTIDNGVLTVSGEKSTQQEESHGQYHRMERSYGSFRRDVVLPSDIDQEKVEATFSKGVLDITLPKPADSMGKVKTIQVKKG